MPTIVDVELQAISGGLSLAKRTLDDVFARVTVNPGPPSDPPAIATIATVIATTQAILTEAQQIQTALQGAGTPGM